MVVTHEIGFARKVADEVAFMEWHHRRAWPPAQVLWSPCHERTREFLARVMDRGPCEQMRRAAQYDLPIG